MIINSLPYECSGTKLYLQSWNRASLGLTRGSRAEIVQTLYHHSTTQHDFVVSPFRNRDWGDLWRFEIHLNDREGQLREIVSELDKFGVTVLASESRKTFDEDSSVKHFMVNCRRYKSCIDGDTHTRQNSASAELSGLRDSLFLSFVEEIRYSEGVKPRISFERNWPHFGLHQRLKAQKDSGNGDNALLKGPETILFGERGMFRLPPNFFGHDSGFRPDLTNRIYVSTNERSKIVYISSYQDRNLNHVSLAVYFSEESRSLERIFSTLTAHMNLKLNVARHQLRQGVFGADPENLRNQLRSENLYTLNVLLETERSAFGTRDELFEGIKSDFLRAFGEDVIVEQRRAFPEGQEY